jgi:hypothetical protein
MRPRTIVWFERVSLVAVTIGVLNVLTVTEIGLVMNGTDDVNAAAVLFGSLIVTLALIFRVSRWRSRAAKWILIMFTLMLLVGNAPVLLTRTDSVAMLVGLAVGAIQLGALALLFTPSARAWLAGDPRPRKMLERTFE